MPEARGGMLRASFITSFPYGKEQCGLSNYVNAFMSTFLSWMRGTVGWLWGIMSGEDGGFLLWVGQNWIVLTVLLCVVCMAVDLIVHMFRWRPYLVWASFFRRIKRRHNAVAHQSDSGHVRRWVYADGRARTEAVSEEEAQEMQPLMIPLALDTTMKQPEVQEENAEAAWADEVLTDEMLEEPAEEPQIEAGKARRRRTDRRPPVSRVRKLAQKMIEPPAERDPIPSRYQAPPVPVSKEDAYHKPYIPPQWRHPGDTGTNE